MADPTRARLPAGDGGLFARSGVQSRLTRALADSAGAVVCGPHGVGISALLTAVARDARASGRRVRHAVAGASPVAIVPDTSRDRGDAYEILVLDDAERLDGDEAARLLQRVLDGRLRCILGSTDPGALPDPLDWLWRSGQLARVEVAPLTTDELAGWVTERVGAPPDSPTLDALMADCAGLPGMLVDTLAALTPAPAETARPGSVGTRGLVVRSGYGRLTGPLPCPPALRRRVAARLADIDDDARSAFERICVTGRLDEASAMTTVSDGSLRELQRRQLVAAGTHRGRQGLAPTAGAIRRVVVAELGAIGVARVAAHLLDDAPGALPLDRELWAALAAPAAATAPTEATIRQLIADKRLDEAELLARSAAARDDPAATVALAQLLADQGDRAGAAGRLETLIDREALDPRVRVQATVELVQILVWDLDQTERAIALTERTVAATGGFEGQAGSIPLAVQTYVGHIAAAVELLGAFEEAGRPLDGLVTGAGATALALAGRLDEAIQLAEGGLARSAGADPTDPLLDPQSQILAISLALTEAGRLDEADRFTTDWYELARRHPPELAWMALARSRVALARGDLPQAEAHGREAEGILARLDLVAPLRWSIATQLLVAGLRGDAEAAARHTERLDAVTPTGVGFLETDVRRARAWARHADGDTLGARRALAAAGDAADGDGNRVLALNAWHDALRLGDRQLAPVAIGRVAAAVSGPWSRAVADHATALLGDDPAALLDAAHGFAAAGRLLEAAEAAAEALDRAGRKDRRALVRLAGTALASWRAACPGAVTPALQITRQAELTGREREVAALAVGGMPSRQIAQELGIAVRTVDNFLSRAYTKLGVRSRAELGAAMADGRDPSADRRPGAQRTAG